MERFSVQTQSTHCGRTPPGYRFAYRAIKSVSFVDVLTKKKRKNDCDIFISIEAKRRLLG